MHLGPLRTFYTHNTCISYVTPVFLCIAHRILFSYQAYRFLPEPSSKPESEKKAEGTVRKRMYLNLASALPNTPDSHELTCVCEASPQGPVLTAQWQRSAKIMEVFSGWAGLAWGGRKKLRPFWGPVHERPQGGNYHLEIGSPTGCHQFAQWWQQTGSTGVVPKGWRGRKAVLTQGWSSAATHLWDPIAQEPKPKLFLY